MKDRSRASCKLLSILVCPACEVGELRDHGASYSRCSSCDRTVVGELLETLRRIVALPDATGAHPCECGHPEMRRLPDGVYRCPACGSEVLPVVDGRTERRSQAPRRRDSR